MKLKIFFWYGLWWLPILVIVAGIFWAPVPAHISDWLHQHQLRIDKWLHFLLFGFLSGWMSTLFCVHYGLSFRKTAVLVSGLLATLAFLDEWHQLGVALQFIVEWRNFRFEPKQFFH